jgi:hypothetical protein
MMNATENTMTEATRTFSAKEQALLVKGSQMMIDCIGCEYTVRTSKTVTVKGVIRACEFGYFQYTGSAIKGVFKITMECGLNKTLREFFVSNLPR